MLLLDDHTGRENGVAARVAVVDVLCEDHSVDPVKTVGERKVRRNLSLRIDPGPVKLIVQDSNRPGHNREGSAEADRANGIVSRAYQP